MAVFKNREVTFERFIGNDDRRVLITNGDGTTQIVDLKELYFTEKEQEEFTKQHVWHLNTVSDEDMSKIRGPKEVVKTQEKPLFPKTSTKTDKAQ